jgi:hypothetical protein
MEGRETYYHWLYSKVSFLLCDKWFENQEPSTYGRHSLQFIVRIIGCLLRLPPTLQPQLLPIKSI